MAFSAAESRGVSTECSAAGLGTGAKLLPPLTGPLLLPRADTLKETSTATSRPQRKATSATDSGLKDTCPSQLLSLDIRLQNKRQEAPLALP